MPHVAHPLRCILKQCLKLAQDAVYGQQKTFATCILTHIVISSHYTQTAEFGCLLKLKV